MRRTAWRAAHADPGRHDGTGHRSGVGGEVRRLHPVGVRGNGLWKWPDGCLRAARVRPATGTRTIAQALTESTGFTVIGLRVVWGGHPGAGFPDGVFGYVSTGGGASLEFIQGKTLPGLVALEQRLSRQPVPPGQYCGDGQSEWNAAGIFTGWENAHLPPTAAWRRATPPDAAGPSMAFCPPSCTPRCNGARSAPPIWPGRRGPRLDPGALVLAAQRPDLTQRCRAATRPRCESSTASSSSRCGAAPMPSGRRRSTEAAWRAQRAMTALRPGLPPEVRPRAESLCLRLRAAAALLDRLDCPRPADGRCLLVVSPAPHCGRWSSPGVDSGRPIAGLEIPTAMPLVYQLGPDLRPDDLGGQYLDPHAAREAIEAIKGGSYEPAPPPPPPPPPPFFPPPPAPAVPSMIACRRRARGGGLPARGRIRA